MDDVPCLRHLAVVLALTGLLAACGVPPPDQGSEPTGDEPDHVTPTATARDAPTSDVPDAPTATARDESPGTGLDDVLDTLPRSGPPRGTAAAPHDVLGPGTPVPEVTDVAAVDTIRSLDGDQGAVATVLLLLDGWRSAATTGDRSVLDAVRRPGCAFCASLAASPSGDVLRPEDGYAVTMTSWVLGTGTPSGSSPGGAGTGTGEERTVSVVVHLLTTLEGTVGDVPHLQVVQDETLVLDVHLVRGAEGWGVEGVATRPWGEGP